MFKSKRVKLNKFIKSIMAVMMLLVVLTAVCFIAVEAGHDCEGEGCPICTCIEQCLNILNQVGGGVAVVATTILIANLMILITECEEFEIARNTLVSNKIRMNN